MKEMSIVEIREKLEKSAAALEDRVRPELEAVKDRLTDANSKVVGFIRAHPTPCLLGALALGYVVGRIARAGGARHAGA
jgi:hypothetical protein